MAKATGKAKRDGYPRDLVGYGATLPDPKWPGRARLALQISLNYEGGGELSILHGDGGSEGLLTDTGFPAVRGARSMLVESSFEYGSRRGVWRLLEMFAERKLVVGVLAVAMALARNREAAAAMVEAGHEIVSHGYRWIDYQHVPPAEERKHIRLAVQTLTEITGQRPVGWMTGRPSPNTRRLLVEEGGFLYDRDSLADELHDRLIGRPGRARGLAKFLDYVLDHDRVWICRGLDIAKHWREHHPPAIKTGEGLRPASSSVRSVSPRPGHSVRRMAW